VPRSPGDDGRAEPLESLQVPGSGEVIHTRASLAPGELYLVRAAGAVGAGLQAQDAEFAGWAADGSGAADSVDGTDVGIDIGVSETLPATGRRPAPPSPLRCKWFGGFRPDHVYYLLVTGAGAQLWIHLVRPAGAPFEPGALTLALFRLSPAPPALGAPLETVVIDGTWPGTTPSRLASTAGAIYVIEAAGEIQVGGPGHMGDAEFHDYKADGRGHNEGEAEVDFGVGVDEPDVPNHPQRTRKWGPFRRDHTYYMLFAGTGRPIGFNYHDSGGRSGRYKDNAGRLPVAIFAAP
jgi:hypothetical protein